MLYYPSYLIIRFLECTVYICSLMSKQVLNHLLWSYSITLLEILRVPNDLFLNYIKKYFFQFLAIFCVLGFDIFEYLLVVLSLLTSFTVYFLDSLFTSLVYSFSAIFVATFFFQLFVMCHSPISVLGSLLSFLNTPFHSVIVSTFIFIKFKKYISSPYPHLPNELHF